MHSHLLYLTSGLDENSKEFIEAYEGRCKAWDEYFDEIPKKFKDKDGKEYDHNTPLDLHS